MTNTNPEWFFIFVFLFGAIGLITPFISASFDSTFLGGDASVLSLGAIGALNAITSILGWNFFIPSWYGWIYNIVAVPFHFMMYAILWQERPLKSWF